MSEPMFIRVHDAKPEEKGQALRIRAAELREGVDSSEVFTSRKATFADIPASPFAYWLSESVRNVFRRFPPLEGNAGEVKQGLTTTDDVRFIRAWYEVACRRIGTTREGSSRGEPWIPLSKGGVYSPYFADLELVVDWFQDGASMKAAVSEYRGRRGWGYNWSATINGHSFYFRPGLTWPRRTTGLSFRPFPAGAIFSDKGSVILGEDDDPRRLLELLGVVNSTAFEALVRVRLGSTEIARSYEIGLLSSTPVPSGSRQGLSELVLEAHALARQSALHDEPTHAFTCPSLIRPDDSHLSITRVATVLASEEQAREQKLIELQHEIDERVFALYDLPEAERARIRVEVNGTSTSAVSEEAESTEQVVAEEDDAPAIEDLATRVANVLMWCVGVAFGRWDARMARDPSLIPELQGPFERLPRVAPGGLVGPGGLPATAERIASEAWLRARPNVITLPEPGSVSGPVHIPAEEYPIEVAWDGIVVDDEGHPRDIVARVREVLRYVYGERANQIEEEALQILQGGGRTPRTLRDWFRNQKASDLGKNFFDFHIQRYSKSRRKAPIYWRLCSNPGRGQAEYAVWLYYHRLTDDTLWTVLTEYVTPKQRLEESRLRELRELREGATGAEQRRLEKEIEARVQLLDELAWFEQTLRTIAQRGYAPDLDDGVIINLAPLHALVPWKEPDTVWKKLEKGDYDWAKLAMKYWPERVREKCREDKSLAIAHGAEELYEES